MNLFAVSITEHIPDQLYKEVLSKISLEKQTQIRRFSHHKDAIRGITAEVLTLFILSRVLNTQIRNIRICHNAYSKPYLPDFPSTFHNISHSGDWVVLVIDDLPVGVDIEEIKPIDFSIVERFFSADEIYEFKSRTEDKKQDYFFDLWTLKESYIKAEGKGLFIPLNSFSILNIDGNFILKDKLESSKYYLKQYSLDNRYKLSVCARSTEFSEQINLINQVTLYNDFLHIIDG
jgi:4'-phosphopantetheinyl transferase